MLAENRNSEPATCLVGFARARRPRTSGIVDVALVSFSQRDGLRELIALRERGGDMPEAHWHIALKRLQKRLVNPPPRPSASIFNLSFDLGDDAG